MDNDEERSLSASETLIMKAIWDADSDISVPDLMEVMQKRFGKDYKRTTMATFLLRLAEKGYIRTYRVGKFSYVKTLKSEEEYKRHLAKEQTEFWFQGKASNFLVALYGDRGLSEEDAERIQEILDGLE